MTDTYGPLPLPVPTPAAGDALADPILDTLLSFFSAVLTANAGAAWAARTTTPTSAVIANTFAYNPDGYFVVRPDDLPALYLHRSTIGKATWVSADWRVRPSTLLLSYVWPHRPYELQWLVDPFANAIHSVLDAAIEKGRHPAWIVALDTQPMAPVTPAGTGPPPTVTLTGVPSTDVTTLLVDIVVAGILATATFRWSADNGSTWSSTVPTAASVALGTTGLTAHFTAGTYDADNLYTSTSQLATYDPRAATEGSFLWKHAPVVSLSLGQATRRPLAIRTTGAAVFPPLQRVEIPIDLRERLTRDLTAYDEIDAVDFTSTTEPETGHTELPTSHGIFETEP